MPRSPAPARRSSARTWLIGILKHKIADVFRENSKAPLSYDELLHAESEDQIVLDGDLTPACALSSSLHAVDAGPEAAIEAHRQLITLASGVR